MSDTHGGADRTSGPRCRPGDPRGRPIDTAGNTDSTADRSSTAVADGDGHRPARNKSTDTLVRIE
ncbi:hypothetical protein EA473_04240 [Natrarchaeobius chitinivorans]|uniref:Uncharacterized protein n=1 Tax=Natrarchaeobius chitinivorans TaxID=1679083 RepID=A0A3N6MMH8_NATCH|nr:hypothetical protein EA473_04240 [Natrarchaeobius chitinivorans]